MFNSISVDVSLSEIETLLRIKCRTEFSREVESVVWNPKAANTNEPLFTVKMGKPIATTASYHDR